MFSHRVKPLTILRAVAVIALGLLSCAWIASLPIELLRKQSADHEYTAGMPLIEHLPDPPKSTDTLVIRISITDVGVQQRYGYIVWSQRQPQGYSRLYSFSFPALADGQMHQYVIPIGIHPEWRADVHSVALAFLQQARITIRIGDVQLINRPSWALDALLGRLLAPYLSVLPPWPYLVLFVAAILGGGLALVWPVSHWRRRLAVAGLLVGGATGMVVIASLMMVVSLLYRVYGSLDETATIIQVPAYDSPAQINQVLVAASNQLPDGSILVSDTYPGSYLLQRARYLLYPRPVVGIAPVSSTELRRQLAIGYVGLIEEQNTNQAPLPDWQPIGDSTTAPTIWRAPYRQLRTPPPAAGRWAIVGLIVGLSLVVAVGCGIAGLIGALGWTRLIYAWPLGVSLLSWWMFSLSILEIEWSWWSIGLPFSLVVSILIGRGRLYWRATSLSTYVLRPRLGWELGGALVILLLVALVTTRALLLPFTDMDSWSIWALRGRSFYLDGRIEPILHLYDNTRYPPAQSLIQTWGYLAMGGISERLVKVIFPLWYVTCLGIVWLACRQWHSGPVAMLWTLLVATTPILLDHATLGNADLPLAVGLLAGAFMLCRWIETGTQRWLLGGVLALGGAAWIKFDGILLGAGLLGAATLARSISLQRDSQRFGFTVLAGMVALGAFMALIIPWQLYVRALELRPYIPGVGEAMKEGWTISFQGLIVWGEEVLFSHSNSTWSLLGSGYGALWLVCGGALMAGWRRLNSDAVLWFLLLAVGGSIGFYVAFYTLIRSDFIYSYFYSTERYLLHIAPLAVLAAARSTSQAGRL